MLNCTVEKSYVVKWTDFEAFVKKVYGQAYDFVSDIECGNDSAHVYNDIIQKELFIWEQENLEEFRKSGKHTDLCMTLLQDLVNRGEISPGNYRIDVCW